MAKNAFRQAKSAKRKSEAWEKRRKRRVNAKAPFFVTARLSCGCCRTTLHFKSRESAVQAFEIAGCGNSVTVVDDLGVSHKGIDTFYGFWAEENDKPLERLSDLVTGRRSWPE